MNQEKTVTAALNTLERFLQWQRCDGELRVYFDEKLAPKQVRNIPGINSEFKEIIAGTDLLGGWAAILRTCFSTGDTRHRYEVRYVC